jgi:release factor glutamine methyltransferase
VNTYTIANALSWAREQLKAQGVSDDGVHDSAAIDSKVLLAACLECEQVYLHTWPEELLNEHQVQRFEASIRHRILGHPVAHIVGFRDFWAQRLKVSPATLIPRPETELLVELALELDIGQYPDVLDLGTGTGAIALALASEKPTWKLTGADKSQAAVVLAKENALLNQLKTVKFIQSDWYSAFESQRFDLIVSNPPYIEIDNHYLTQGDVRFEPHSALVSGSDGLDDIRTIVAQSTRYLKAGGWLAIEHGYQQKQALFDILKTHGFYAISTELDLNGLPRVTLARC